MTGEPMRRSFRTALFCLAACFVAPIASRHLAAANDTVSLSGQVLGSSGRYVVYVALWQAEGFLKQPIQQVRIEPGAERIFRFDVPAGLWAISAFEDRDGNGILDMGLFGPKEPSGFWRAFHGHHKPRFDEVSSLIQRDTSNADIVLR